MSNILEAKRNIEREENTYGLIEVMTNKLHRFISFKREHFDLYKVKHDNTFQKLSIRYNEVDRVEEVKKTFRMYDYVIHFGSQSIKINAVDRKENKNIINQINNHRKNLFNEDGSIFAEFVKEVGSNKLYKIGSDYVAGHSFKEKELNECKQEQFQEKKEGTLEGVTIESNRDNEFDSKAVKVLVSGRHVGFIPKVSKLKDSVNDLIDRGLESSIHGVIDYEFDYLFKDSKENIVEVSLYFLE